MDSIREAALIRQLESDRKNLANILAKPHNNNLLMTLHLRDRIALINQRLGRKNV